MRELTTIESILIAQAEKQLENTAKSSSLFQHREAALSEFKSLGLPVERSEAYKYTPIAKVLRKNFNFDAEASVPTFTQEACEAHFYDDQQANHVVFVNGNFHEKFSRWVSPSDEMVFLPLEEHLDDEGVKTHFGKVRGSETDPFSSLNLSMFSQGLLIKTKKNQACRDTYIYHLIDASAPGLQVYPRLFIHAGNSSKSRFFEKTFTKGNENFLNIPIIEAIVEENAETRYTKIQDYTTNHFSIEGIFGYQKRNSRFYTNTFTFKSGLTRNTIHINIDGENCEAHMHGLYQLAGKSHVDNNTTVDHLKPHSYSNELYKGILDENSRGVFNGKIYVRPDAQKTNAFQANNNILLSDTAVINTKPQLEIWADDVQCSHGCTTGQLDEEALFYLRSRGIGLRTAKALMLNAFANEALTALENELVKEEIESIISKQLHS